MKDTTTIDVDDIPKPIDTARPWRLNRRAERIIDLMIAGNPMERPQEPLDPYAAAKEIGFTRKAMRFLLEQPAFIEALEEKRRLHSRDGYLTCMTPTAEHIRDTLRWQQERRRLKDEVEKWKRLASPNAQPRRDPSIKLDEAAE
jgi:hypothetical protein